MIDWLIDWLIDSGKKKQCRKGGGKTKRKGKSENKAATENIIISYQSANLTKKPSNSTSCSSNLFVTDERASLWVEVELCSWVSWTPVSNTES